MFVESVSQGSYYVEGYLRCLNSLSNFAVVTRELLGKQEERDLAFMQKLGIDPSKGACVIVCAHSNKLTRFIFYVSLFC